MKKEQNVSYPRLTTKHIASITTFIKSISNNTEDPLPWSEFGTLFGTREDGQLILFGDESVRYYQLIREISSDLCSKELISQQFVERAIQKAILESLDIFNKHVNLSKDQLIKKAIDNLKVKIHTKPKEFCFFYPIFGLSEKGLPFQFGETVFFKFSEMDYEALLPKSSGGNNENQWAIPKEELIGKIFSKTKSIGVDYKNSEIVGLKTLKRNIDILNFFCKLVRGNDGFIYLPGEANCTTFSSFTKELQNDLYPSARFQMRFINHNFSIEAIQKENNKRNIGFEQICELLKEQPNELQSAILDAMCWAGRASVHYLMEEIDKAFLFFAISLESLFVPDGKVGELTYRLSTRIGHLLGNDIDARKNISSEVKALYKKRSDIVHLGSFEITEGELQRIFGISKSAIIQLLVDPQFESINMKQDLMKWFEDRVFE